MGVGPISMETMAARPIVQRNIRSILILNSFTANGAYVGTKTRKFPLPVMDMPVRVWGTVLILAHALTGNMGIVFRDVSLSAFCSVLATTLCIYRLEFNLLNVPVPVRVQYITVTGIQQCPYRYWHFAF